MSSNLSASKKGERERQTVYVFCVIKLHGHTSELYCQNFSFSIFGLLLTKTN
jgi:hypothetical protein